MQPSTFGQYAQPNTFGSHLTGQVIGAPLAPQPDCRLALKYGTIAAIYVLATAIFAATTVVCGALTGLGIAASVATGGVDMGINAICAFILGVCSAFWTYHLAERAWKYCKKTHYALNP